MERRGWSKGLLCDSTVADAFQSCRAGQRGLSGSCISEQRFEPSGLKIPVCTPPKPCSSDTHDRRALRRTIAGRFRVETAQEESFSLVRKGRRTFRKRDLESDK